MDEPGGLVFAVVATPEALAHADEEVDDPHHDPEGRPERATDGQEVLEGKWVHFFSHGG